MGARVCRADRVTAALGLKRRRVWRTEADTAQKGNEPEWGPDCWVVVKTCPHHERERNKRRALARVVLICLQKYCGVHSTHASKLWECAGMARTPDLIVDSAPTKNYKYTANLEMTN